MQVPYGIYEWESIGEALAVSILDLHGSSGHPRQGLQAALEEVLQRLSPGKSLEELEKANPRLALKPTEDSMRQGLCMIES